MASRGGFNGPDPFARQGLGASIVDSLLATAVFRCWHILLFFLGWSTLITVLNQQGHNLHIQPTLLTVIGTVLGFVVSYRTTASFERYNEGRQYWSQIVFASRTFARTVWFHVPDSQAIDATLAKEEKARALIEKKTVINLLEAFAVAVKHYLRGEEGIYYEDLYYLVKFLPVYPLPAGMPSSPWYKDYEKSTSRENSLLYQRTGSGPYLPFPATTNSPVSDNFSGSPTVETLHKQAPRQGTMDSSYSGTVNGDKVILSAEGEKKLLPAYRPPKYHLLDLFPLSLFVSFSAKQGKSGIKGKKAAKLKAKMVGTVSHNLPLEISLYLSSYIAALQDRNVPGSTIDTLLAALNQLVDNLSELERILTTPIPFSYYFHLWAVTAIYCLTLPFQMWTALGWITIPATLIAAFIFFGFLAAGEEIENPFGYDKNDLNLDHFTHNIIRNELRAITATPPPNLAQWAFSGENDLVFSFQADPSKRVRPIEWMERGRDQMETELKKEKAQD